MAPRPCWLLLASLLLFHPSGIISFSCNALNWPRIIFGVTSVLLTIPSTRNHIFLILLILSTRSIPLGVVSLPPTIPSTRNLFFLPHGTSNGIRIIFCDADFLFNFSSPSNHLFLLHASIQQASSFSLTIFYNCFLNWRLISYPFHWNLDRSHNTALYF